MNTDTSVEQVRFVVSLFVNLRNLPHIVTSFSPPSLSLSSHSSPSFSSLLIPSILFYPPLFFLKRLVCLCTLLHFRSRFREAHFNLRRGREERDTKRSWTGKLCYSNSWLAAIVFILHIEQLEWAVKWSNFNGANCCFDANWTRNLQDRRNQLESSRARELELELKLKLELERERMRNAK